MRPAIKRYVAVVISAAILLVVGDLATLVVWPQSWSLLLVPILLVLCAAAEHLHFKVHSGWSTHAGTVPHLAAALILPPGLAALVAGLGMLSYTISRRIPGPKAAFNTASVTLAVAAAAHVATSLGGRERLIGGDNWAALPIVIGASATYYFVSASTVSVVVALDQRRSFTHILRGKIGVKALTEIALGLLGSTLAVVLMAAPSLTPALVLPAILVYIAKQSMDRAERRSRDLALTNTVGRAVAGSLNLELAFQAILDRSVRDTLKLDGLALVPLGHLAAFDEQVATDVDQPQLRAAIARQMLVDPRQIELTGDGHGTPRWLPAELRHLRAAVAAVPCRVGSEDPSGALVAWRGSHANPQSSFNKDELLLLETLADYAAVALETTRLFHATSIGRVEAEEREARIRAVMEGVADGILTFDDQMLIESCNPAAERIFGYSAEELVGQPVTLLWPNSAGEELADVGTDESSAGASALAAHREVKGHRKDGAALPIDLVISDLLLEDRRLFIAVVRDVTERKAFEAQLAHLAFHDPLTTLPNRALFMDRLGHALTRADHRSHSVAVLFLDLDNFKVVNDSLGHKAGDQLLETVGKRLQACLRPVDTAARLGGDEFTILLEDIRDIGQVSLLAERIAETLAAPINLDGHELSTSTSIGIAIGTSSHDRPDVILANADAAMYRAKANGKARWELFEESMGASAMDRLQLEIDLRHALKHDEFRVHYQPIVSLQTGRIVEVEALVRWDHPQRGLVSPADFIPLAEETGLIVPIGQWVLKQACEQARAWQTQYPSDSPIAMSVNLSARQFQHPNLVQDIAQILDETGLQRRVLKLEITESVVMQKAESTVSTLRELKDLGIQLAIDDFGTGYSSLSYLKRFPVDTLKIDRTFVDGLGRDPHDTAIVEAVIALAKALNLTVTGEGIETAEQRNRLRMLGCDRGQGYFLARPLAPTVVSKMLADERAPSDTLPRAA
jgi:diguanylate cyclase (GGDEF)-like protein/PAS domain S-box-containing protein